MRTEAWYLPNFRRLGLDLRMHWLFSCSCLWQIFSCSCLWQIFSCSCLWQVALGIEMSLPRRCSGCTSTPMRKGPSASAALTASELIVQAHQGKDSGWLEFHHSGFQSLSDGKSERLGYHHSLFTLLDSYDRTHPSLRLVCEKMQKPNRLDGEEVNWSVFPNWSPVLTHRYLRFPRNSVKESSGSCQVSGRENFWDEKKRLWYRGPSNRNKSESPSRQ